MARPRQHAMSQATRRGARTAISLVLLATQGRAYADDKTMKDKERALTLFKSGTAKLDSGLFEGACKDFRDSNALLEDVGTYVGLAKCHAAQGLLLEARRDCEDGIKLSDKRPTLPGKAKLDQELATQLVAVARRLPRISISVTPVPDSLEVTVDGHPVVLTNGQADVDINPGKAVIHGTAAGYQTIERTRELTAGVVLKERIELKEVAAPNPQDHQPLLHKVYRIAGMTVVVLGHTSLLASGILGIAANVQKGRSDGECLQGRCNATGGMYFDSSLQLARTADACIGVGVAFSLIGGALFTYGKVLRRPVAINPTAWKNGIGVEMKGTF